MPQMSIKMSDESKAVIAQHVRRPAELMTAMRAALKQGLEEIAAHLQSNYLRGGSWREPRRGNTPLAVRTGSLMRSIQTRLDGPLSGFVGSANNKYARMLLGDQTVGITPKRANHLWIPLPDNMTGGGIAKMSPREAMSVRTSTGKRALRIFKSKKGNLVAFMPGKVVDDKVGRQMGLVRGSGTSVSAGRHKRGEFKGRDKGQLLFMLKKFVVVEGTDALAKSVQDKAQRMTDLLNEAINKVAAGGGGDN